MGVARGLERDLRAIVPADAVLAAARFGPYCHDATIQRGLRGQPQAVVCPEQTAQIGALLRYCEQHSLPLVPRGGGTGLAGGASPLAGGVVLCTERLRMVASDPAEPATLVVGAGVRTAEVQRLARERGLLFAPDPGGASISTIGGNVATNAGGPHALGYGRTGAFVCGLEVVLSGGERAWCGEGERRERCGYDLPALLIGSEGTLGVISAVKLRLLPAPQVARTWLALFEACEQAQSALDLLLASGLAPSLLDFFDGPTLLAAAARFPARQLLAPLLDRGRQQHARGALALVVELDGHQASAVNERGQELCGLLEECGPLRLAEISGSAFASWREGLGPLLASLRGGRVNDDLYVPPRRLGEALAGIAAIGEELAVESFAFGHAGEGVVHASFLAAIERADERERAHLAGERALELGLELGGAISGEHGIGAIKVDLYAQRSDPAALRVQRAIKQALDPHGVLNPGKKLRA
ncbi:MAG TPA: FAD-linked oxidase C-terminal domain-containing protein [Solirubrobacteraceae bacterium]|nr:FAD-linked oxidase C-terminal domain-containing protein [Solirubrobacteraceae bacterium]